MREGWLFCVGTGGVWKLKLPPSRPVGFAFMVASPQGPKEMECSAQSPNRPRPREGEPLLKRKHKQSSCSSQLGCGDTTRTRRAILTTFSPALLLIWK